MVHQPLRQLSAATRIGKVRPSALAPRLCTAPSQGRRAKLTAGRMPTCASHLEATSQSIGHQSPPRLTESRAGCSRGPTVHLSRARGPPAVNEAHSPQIQCDTQWLLSARSVWMVRLEHWSGWCAWSIGLDGALGALVTLSIHRSGRAPPRCREYQKAACG